MIFYIVISPLFAIACTVLIGVLIDFISSAIVLVIVILVIGVGSIHGRVTEKLSYKEGLYTDRQNQLLEEAFSGPQTIKSYGWEPAFFELITFW
jgi:ABC-type bacteriocin/lantibiotic exporter with double-glycine peptidase domain